MAQPRDRSAQGEGTKLREGPAPVQEKIQDPLAGKRKEPPPQGAFRDPLRLQQDQGPEGGTGSANPGDQTGTRN